jgi:hypothetical protein
MSRKKAPRFKRTHGKFRGGRRGASKIDRPTPPCTGHRYVPHLEHRQRSRRQRGTRRAASQSVHSNCHRKRPARQKRWWVEAPVQPRPKLSRRQARSCGRTSVSPRMKIGIWPDYPADSQPPRTELQHCLSFIGAVPCGSLRRAHNPFGGAGLERPLSRLSSSCASSLLGRMLSAARASASAKSRRPSNSWSLARSSSAV